MPAKPSESAEPQTLRADALQIPVVPVTRKLFAEQVEVHLSLFPPGTKLYVRNQGSWSFVSPSPEDTLLFPTDHAKAGQERYTWAPHPTAKGVSIGTLVAD